MTTHLRNEIPLLLAIGCLLAASPVPSPAGEVPGAVCPADGTSGVRYSAELAQADVGSLSPWSVRFANGLHVTVYGEDLLRSRMTTWGMQDIIPLEDGRYLSVITDINDPSICNKGDGEFHPFPEALVLEVLEGISHDAMDIDVDVYILPFPRTNVLVSSTSGLEVYLSPHVLEIRPEVGAYIVAHEIGHVFHDAYMPDGSVLWDRYRQIRGIGDAAIYYATASHAYRPKEVFAEDFRVLFGGEDASFGGNVENPDLPSPTTVPGLRAFISRIGGVMVATRPKVRAANYPNPFNPDTEIRLAVPDEILAANEPVKIRIYNVRGALVRELYSAVPSSENFSVRWDGRDATGNTVASSNYFASIEAGGTRTTLKLVMLK